MERMSSSRTATSPVQPTPRAIAGAWAVHALTLSGLLWALLALKSLSDGNIAAMWGWLGVALIVDGLDGSLARRARVREVIPWFDGTTLDNLVDYLTWTFIPALFIATHIDLGGDTWAWAAAALICISSMFCYCNTGVKSFDFFFVGFPAAWNVVGVALWILQLPAWGAGAAIVILAALTLVPWTYLHPFRVRRLMPFNIVAVTIWIATTGILVADHPHRSAGLLALWWISGLWFLLVSALRTVQGGSAPAAPTAPAAAD